MRPRSWTVLLVLACTLPALCADEPLKYPDTKRGDQTDVYHGTKVSDPYRWLEADIRESKEVTAWIDAENKVTEAYLSKIPERSTLRKRLTDLWNYEKYSAPIKTAGRYFFFKNDGLQNQDVLYMQDSLDAKPVLVLDPNTWSEKGTIALSGSAVSPDGKYLAYSKSEAGSDWQTWYALDLATLKPLPDEIKWTKFTEAAWTKDGRGFFYSRFDEPKKGQELQDLNLNMRVFYHRLGTPQSDDVLVYKRPDFPKWFITASVTDDGRYLMLGIGEGGTDPRNRISYKDLQEPLALPVDLIENFDNEYTFVGNDGPIFYFKTDLDAPRSRLVAIDIRKPQKENWKELIPQAKETLSSVSHVGNLFVASYMKDAYSDVKVFRTDGRLLREVALPGIGTAAGFGGRPSDTETFYTFASFATPPSNYRYDLITGESKLLRRAGAKVNPEDFEVKQVFYPSKDGTKVPMFIAHKKGISLDGTNPTLLYGYGGFAIPLTPEFGRSYVLWMQMGGVYAQPCLRGGGEYGEDWHQAGKIIKKQNVFDDFIAAGEWLIANKYTSTKRLAIKGESNGGLLVGAVLVQRPDLFGACLPGVGVMDMLRFHQFTAGRFWVDEYGSSEKPEQFKSLFAYSPYHNLKKGVKYPSTLITTANTDDRVVPAHSFKFAAQLQYCQGGPAPVLIRIETDAGHGGGKPTAKIIEEVADQWAFLVKNLEMKLPAK
jgi:prolyl oligopeptidase